MCLTPHYLGDNVKDAFTADCLIAAFTVINAELVREDADFVKFYSDVARWWKDRKKMADLGAADGVGGSESRRAFREYIDNYFN